MANLKRKLERAARLDEKARPSAWTSLTRRERSLVQPEGWERRRSGRKKAHRLQAGRRTLFVPPGPET